MNKKKLGQFFTNPVIAEFMVKLGYSDNLKKVLDPSVGPGVFIKYLNKINSKCEKTVFELDQNMIKLFKENVNDNSKIINSDYLKTDIKEKYDLIICNPPYKKFQEIDDRKQLIEIFKNKYSIKMSGYSNYCVYFLIKSINELNINGKCVYIIPYEFLNCGYGEVIKKYLVDKKILSKIIKFDNKIKLFNDATTTSCIILLENKNNENVQFINVSSLEKLNLIWNDCNENNNEVFLYNYKELNYKEKWSKYFRKKEDYLNNDNFIRLKEIARVKRGIATGDNKYFLLNIEKIKKYNLSNCVCEPCICKSSDVDDVIFDQKKFNELKRDNKKVFLFDGRNSVTKSDNNYIKLGESLKVNKRYLTSHRNPWYSIEEKKVAPIWISVFSRNKIKVVRNEMMIKNLTTFHGIYLNNNDDINILFCYLLTPISHKILYLNKREYGEGLDKFEPNDLNDANILNLNIISADDKKKILILYEQLKSKNVDKVISKLNDIFVKYVNDTLNLD